MSKQALTIEITPCGPAAGLIHKAKQVVATHVAVQAYLKQTRNRLLSFDLIDDEDAGKKGDPLTARKFRATFYDYSFNRVIRATGYLANPTNLSVAEYGDQPAPPREEFEEALEYVRTDPAYETLFQKKLIESYQPIPALLNLEQLNGEIERTLMVGLAPAQNHPFHDIVAVNLIRQSVMRIERRVLATTQGFEAGHGIRRLVQSPADVFTGQVWLTVKRAGRVIWKCLVVRPAVSSGTCGSGVELRCVDYRGKRVLHRAHLPIVTVRDGSTSGGSFRTRLNEESSFQAKGRDVAPGFRLCGAPASDTADISTAESNLLGVAIFVAGEEVVLASEIAACGYRYVSQWRLQVDGTIRPRFGLSSASDAPAWKRYHHAYWRFDFDIRTPGNNVVHEFNNPPLVAGSNWHTKRYETMRQRGPSDGRKWRVENSISGESYDLIPGPNDSLATEMPDWPYPRGDLWVLRYHSDEIDDGVDSTLGGPTEVDLNQFVNGESLLGEDVVLWYGAHFANSVALNPFGESTHLFGPELKPVKWP